MQAIYRRQIEQLVRLRQRISKGASLAAALIMMLLAVFPDANLCEIVAMHLALNSNKSACAGRDMRLRLRL